MIPFVLALGGMLGAAGCAEVPAVPSQEPVPYSPDFPVQEPDVQVGAPAITMPADESAPAVDILAPADGFATAEGVLALRATVSDDAGVSSVRLSINGTVVGWLPAPAEGELAVAVAVAVGAVTLRLDAFDASGHSAHATVSGERKAAEGDSGAPHIAIASPADGASTAKGSVEVWGTASDDGGVASVHLVVGPDGAAFEAVTATGYATWYAVVPLPPGQESQVMAVAVDGAGNEAHASVTVRQVGVADPTPPTVLIAAPLGTAPVAFVAAGTAADEGEGVAAVLVRIDDQPFRLVGSGATWELPLFAGPGLHSLQALAIDGAGNTALAERLVEVVAEGPVHAATLALHAPSAVEVSLAMDRSLLEDALPPDKAAQVVILELDPQNMLEGALDVMKDACGAGWGTAEFAPQCPPVWGQPERNMWRLLTMTPATSDVTGTSFANLAEIANVLSTYDNLIDDFSSLLALTLGRESNEPLVTNSSVATAIRDLLIATHPHATPEGRLPITLQDALEDMAPLAGRFGPTGDHPGFLVGETHSKVLGDDFSLELTATSNLHWHEGLLLGQGKGMLAFRTAGEGQVIDVDFLDEATFQVVGLVDDPRVDLAFAMQEDDAFLLAGQSPFPLGQGDSEVWDASAYAIERVVAEAARRDFADYTAGCSLCGGKSFGALLWEIPEITMQDNDLAEVVVGEAGYGQNGSIPEHFPPLDPNPPGWMRVWTVGGLGYPAGVDKSSAWTIGYVWDIVLEVAQRRLLDGGVAQGEGDVKFPLTDVPVGLTEDELVAGVRKAMQGSEAVLVDLLLGSWYANGDDADIFLGEVTLPDGQARPALILAALGDPTPSLAFGAAGPQGFFADAALTQPAGMVMDAAAFGPEGPGVVAQRQVWVVEAISAWEGPVYVASAGGSVFRLYARKSGDDRIDVVTEALGGP